MTIVIKLTEHFLDLKGSVKKKAEYSDEYADILILNYIKEEY
jgi:hypothetical protein